MSIKLNSLSKISKILYKDKITFKHLFIIIHKLEFPNFIISEYYEDNKYAKMILLDNKQNKINLSFNYKNKNKFLEEIKYMNLTQKLNVIRKLVAIIWHEI